MRALGLRATSAGSKRSVQKHADRLGADYGHFTGNRTWDENQLRHAIAESRSWTGVQLKLGLSSGASTSLLKGHAVRLGIDFSHFSAVSPVPAKEFPEPKLEYLRRAGGVMAATWFILCGRQISWPLEPCRFDLIVHDDLEMRRVQVKTTTRKSGSSWLAEITTSGRIKVPYDPDEIDDFFIIDGDLNFYLIPIEAVGGFGALQLNAYRQYRLPRLHGLFAAA
ncbi:hypothetical protein SAMN06298212_10484 [Ruaniaceae bacterium KH17]|nr:hypothetical protein SAMN06298212_10484 [Ruaniaceae bacterium KH17]